MHTGRQWLAYVYGVHEKSCNYNISFISGSQKEILFMCIFSYSALQKTSIFIKFLLDINNKRFTHMALVIELVIGHFEFVEAYNLAHPRLTGSRRIRMNVDARRDWRVGVTRYHPLRAVVHVP